MQLVFFLIGAAAGAPNATAPANPLGRAEQGELQCYQPDVAQKTCQSIAAYRRTGPGAYDNKAIVALGDGATLETRTPVVLKDGAVCGSISVEDVMAGILTVGNRVLTPEEAKPILDRIVHGMATMIGKEICTRYEPSGTDFKAKATIGGVDQPEDITVKWIKPTDGYTASR